jgi:HTH DNA binding domain
MTKRLSPIVSAGMIPKAVKVTPRGALNLIGELGVREITGRGRYRHGVSFSSRKRW